MIKFIFLITVVCNLSQKSVEHATYFDGFLLRAVVASNLYFELSSNYSSQYVVSHTYSYQRARALKTVLLHIIKYTEWIKWTSSEGKVPSIKHIANFIKSLYQFSLSKKVFLIMKMHPLEAHLYDLIYRFYKFFICHICIWLMQMNFHKSVNDFSYSKYKGKYFLKLHYKMTICKTVNDQIIHKQWADASFITWYM